MICLSGSSKEPNNYAVNDHVTELKELYTTLHGKTVASGTCLLNVDRDEIWRIVLVHYKKGSC